MLQQSVSVHHQAPDEQKQKDDDGGDQQEHEAHDPDETPRQREPRTASRRFRPRGLLDFVTATGAGARR